MPALQSRWLYVHTTLAFLGDAFFVIAFAGGVLYLVQERQLKRRHPGAFYHRLPSLDLLDRVNYRSLTIGFPLLTLGIITGAIWAENAWGSYWQWDPKETWSLITWFIYAALVHARLTVGWRGRKAAWLSIVGLPRGALHLPRGEPAPRRPALLRMTPPDMAHLRRSASPFVTAAASTGRLIPRGSCALRLDHLQGRQGVVAELRADALMDIIVLGLNHKTAPVHIRERVAFPEKSIHEPLRALHAAPGVRETMILSTCNRVEIAAVVDGREQGAAAVRAFVARHHEVPEGELAPHLYLHAGADAVRHLFRVASSLDSLVVGEPQILGQVKDAYQYAREAGAVGAVLDRLLKKALSVAKLVRTETEISRSAVSVSFAAVELAKKIFGEIEGRTAMIVGAGEMAELAVKHLVSQRRARGARRQPHLREGRRAGAGVRRLGGAVRRALRPAGAGGHRHLLDRRAALHHQGRGREEGHGAPQAPADVLHRHRGAARHRAGGQRRRQRLPLQRRRPAVGRRRATSRSGARRPRRPSGSSTQEVGTFEKWIASLQVVPTIVQLRQQVDAMRAAELEKSLGKLRTSPRRTASRWRS